MGANCEPAWPAKRVIEKLFSNHQRKDFCLFPQRESLDAASHSVLLAAIPRASSYKARVLISIHSCSLMRPRLSLLLRREAQCLPSAFSRSLRTPNRASILQSQEPMIRSSMIGLHHTHVQIQATPLASK